MTKNLFIYLTQETFLETVNNGYPFNPILGFHNNENKSKPFYLLPFSEAKAELDDSDLPDAILVYDLIDKNEKRFCNNISRIIWKYQEVYIAYHSKGLQPTDIKNCYFEDKIIVKEGRNEPNNALYQTAINFINGDDEAIEKALVAFKGDPVLKFKLNFLHKCLTPPEANKLRNEALENIDEGERKAFSIFKNCIKGIDDPLNEGYSKCLDALRKEWVKE